MSNKPKTKLLIFFELVKAYNMLNGWHDSISVKHIFYMETRGHTILQQHAWVAKKLGA